MSLPTLGIEAPPEPIDGYRLIERLGVGGYGEVWKAEAPGGLFKAVKLVYGDLKTISPDGVNAERELKALTRVKAVRHPYILSLERFDIVEGQLIIVTELADCNLWDRFRECRNAGLDGIPRDELLCYLEETAEALDVMSTRYDLQHLDVKPHNLFLVSHHVKVGDFGLVRDLGRLPTSATKSITPVYAAPETFDGRITRFSDQYSLAIVYEELLTGVRPFNATNIRQLLVQHVKDPPNLEPLPTPDRLVVAQALSKEPNDRFPSASDFVDALCRSSRPNRRLMLAYLRSSSADLLAAPSLPVDDTGVLCPMTGGESSDAASSGLILANVVATQRRLLDLQTENTELRRMLNELNDRLDRAEKAENVSRHRQRDVEQGRDQLRAEAERLRKQIEDLELRLAQERLAPGRRPPVAEPPHPAPATDANAMTNLKDLAVAVSRERADLARQRQELGRLQAELKRELEAAARDTNLRERLAPLRQRLRENEETSP